MIAAIVSAAQYAGAIRTKRRFAYSQNAVRSVFSTRATTKGL
jgi:hypothetical protein